MLKREQPSEKYKKKKQERFQSNENNEHRTKLFPKRDYIIFVYGITNFSLNKNKILFILYFIGWHWEKFAFSSTSTTL